MKDIPILFENDDGIVFNKPAGLPVQGGASVKVSLDRLLTETRFPRPLLVHRLDKDTSGIILVAKHKAAAVRFSAIFSRGKGIDKQYLAICAGSPPHDSGVIRLDLDVRGMTKQSETAYKRLSEHQGFSLLELELGTGRMHQIRRHLAGIGNPVLGDDKYGDFALNKSLRKSAGLKQLLLHAVRLVFAEPIEGFPPHITAPLPEYFTSFLLRFGLHRFPVFKKFSEELIVTL
jgi:23S rRNA pseudouridine955/2504/2580 synthase